MALVLVLIEDRLFDLGFLGGAESLSATFGLLALDLHQHPGGLLVRDPWNIRLLPYYLGGVFFVVAHAFCGLRIVMLAHHAPRASADRVLVGGTVFAALLATTIILAMCGLRLHFAA